MPARREGPAGEQLTRPATAWPGASSPEMAKAPRPGERGARAAGGAGPRGGERGGGTLPAHRPASGADHALCPPQAEPVRAGRPVVVLCRVPRPAQPRADPRDR